MASLPAFVKQSPEYVGQEHQSHHPLKLLFEHAYLVSKDPVILETWAVPLQKTTTQTQDYTLWHYWQWAISFQFLT